MGNHKKEIIVYDTNLIQKKIYMIRGVRVMLDEDLAILYDVETKRLNEQVKRNIERFPEKFIFRLSKEEYENLMSQIAISSSGNGGRRKPPYAFTEQGVAMLSAVLSSETAVKVCIQIIITIVNSLNDLGKKWFAFSKMDKTAFALMDNLKKVMADEWME